jgi:triphosphoribosyl-dephospho-CoA synthase
MSMSPEALRQAYLEACEIELRAFKPGNVSLYSQAPDMSVEDFRQSAQASSYALCDPLLSLGEAIFLAVKATREVVACNTNLGIVLLAAPLAQASLHGNSAASLRENLQQVLKNTTRLDADWAYKAIRLASPGGLGKVEAQDVHAVPSVNLLEAMEIAAGRDRIAWQYANSYTDVFDLAIPRYDKGMSIWGDEAWAALGVFTALLKTYPDSHVERKFGALFNQAIADKMALVEQALSVADRPEKTLGLLREMDAEFKSAGINPGTTADLTVACLFAVRLAKWF